MELGHAVAPSEDTCASRDDQFRVLVGDVWPLHGYVAVVTEVETVLCLIAVTFLLGVVRY